MGPWASLAMLLMIRQTPDHARATTHAFTAACVIVPDRASTDRFKNVGAMRPAAKDSRSVNVTYLWHV